MVYAGLLAAHRKLPVRVWIGPRRVWLRGHIWLGLLSAVFLLCHSGFRWGGTLEILLWAAVLGVLATGIVGLLLQQFVPRIITTRVQAEGPYEQIPHLCRVMRQNADALVDAACGEFDPRQADIETTRAAMRLAEDGKTQFRAFYEQDVRPFLAAEIPPNAPLANPLQAEARFAKLTSMASMAEAATGGAGTPLPVAAPLAARPCAALGRAAGLDGAAHRLFALLLIAGTGRCPRPFATGRRCPTGCNWTTFGGRAPCANGNGR
jgi:hypothetical protein